MTSSIFPTEAFSTRAADAVGTGTNIFGKTPEQIARDSPKYAFTEFITFKFRQGVQLEEETTAEGRIWANTVKTYLEQDGVGPVWWGRIVEERDAVKLVVEWHTTAAHQAFRNSSTLRELEAALRQILLTPSLSKSFILPNYSGTRENALSSLFMGPSYTALYTWASLPSSVVPSGSALGHTYNQTSAWEHYWHAFATEAMHTGKNVHNSSASGWEVENDGNSEEHKATKGFCGLMRWADVLGHKAFINRMKGKPGQEGELRGLNDMWTPEMELCHVQFTTLKNGWLGSVVKEQPDVKYPNGLFKQDYQSSP